MTDKVQKIREEVERLKESGCASPILICDTLLTFIDSLQEEPVSIWHDASEEIPTQGSNILMVRKEEKDTNYPPIAGCFHGTNSRLDGRNWGYYNGFCYNEIELPVKWAYIDDILNLSNVERTGKNWKELVSDELEEACEQLAENARKHKAETLSPFFNQTDYKQGVIDGAKWQKSRMTKNAVEKTVGIEEWGHLVIKVDDMCVKYHDKVKVIIIKEK